MIGLTRSLVAFIAKNVFGDSVVAGATHILKKKSVHEFWRLTDEVRQFTREFDKEVRGRDRNHAISY